MNNRSFTQFFFCITFLIGLFGCNPPSSKDGSLIIADQYHNDYYQKGVDYIYPHILVGDKQPTVNPSVRNQIDSGMVFLDAVTKIKPENYSAFWIKGKGYEVLGEHQKAYKAFSKAYNINKENEDVARELAKQCLELGLGTEAVQVSKHAVSLLPNDHGLLGNLALAYLIQGDLEKAQQTIDTALIVLSTDPINMQLKHIIEETIAGKRERPTKFDEL